MAGQIEYPEPEVIKLTGQTHAMGMGVTWWPATDHDPEHFSLGWAAMTPAQVRTFGRQLLQITAKPDAIVPEGEDPLNWLKMCLQGYDYLLADPQPGLHTWQEARARGLRRIVAACLAVAAAVPDEEQGA